MTAVELRVFGTPAPQGSKRHVGGGRMVEASKKVTPWREAIVAECQRVGLSDLRIDSPVTVSVTFFLQRPAGHSGARGIKASAPLYPAKTPDLDKLVRSTLDGLTQAALWMDDARVVILTAFKTYADHTGPGALIRVTEMTEEQK